MRRFVLLDKNRLGVSFPYNEKTIEQIKNLSGRKWNPKEKQWEMPLSHLQDVLAILHVDPRNVPKNILAAYEEKWGGDVDARLVVGNCFTSITGRNLPVDRIDEVTSFWIEGAEHTDPYKKGRWDGRKRLLKKKKEMEFPTGLLDKVIDILVRKKLQYVVEHPVEAPEPSLDVKLKKIKLRDYQEKAVERAVDQERGVLQMATGAGKTVVAAAIIARLGQPALFFVHTKDLLYQAKTYFEKHLGIEVGQIGDGVVDIQPVTVATIQTTSRALGIKIPKTEAGDLDKEPAEVTAREQIRSIKKKVHETPLVFFDECHHLPASTCYSIAMKTEAACFRFGLSATPYRSDRQDLMIEAAAGGKIVKIDSSFLIKRKFLVPPRIHFFPMPPTMKTRKFVRYQTIYQNEIVDNEYRNRFIAELADRFAAEHRTVLILVSQVKHGENIKTFLPDAVLLTGQNKSDFRTETLDALRATEQKIVIATTLADEGLDIPTLEVLVLAGAGKSETRALQRIGRALRKTKEKKEATVIDFFDQAKYLDIHSRRRLEIYQTEPEFKVQMEDDVLRYLKKMGPSQRGLFEGMTS
jgi:superfamily II DNA or RNA helicase